MVKKKYEVAIVLTTRVGSERLPCKATTDIGGKPLIYWVAKRLSEAGTVIVAVPDTVENDTLEKWALDNGYLTFRGSENDVTLRIIGAVEARMPQAQFVMRGLGDCPFVVPAFVQRAVGVMQSYGADAMVWAKPPFPIPVYGAEEFPRSRRAWELINAKARRNERTHPDIYYHRNREKFHIVYHAPPPPMYFRPYRLEVDYPEDLELMRKIAAAFGYLPTMEEAISFLDHNDLWRLNMYCEERTGPRTSYRQSERAKWWQLMLGRPIVNWDDTVLDYGEKGKPVFCKGGICLLGYAREGKLYMQDTIITQGVVKCTCGMGLHWRGKV